MAVKTIARRLRRLEESWVASFPVARLENPLTKAPQGLRIQYGYLKTLPGDYIGARHTVTVRRLPAGPGGDDRFEWEERPGPEPASNATGANDQILVHVCYVEGKAKS